MKFSFNRNALINEISIAQEIISTKNADTITSFVSLATSNNMLTIKAVDPNMNFQANIPVETEIDGTAIVFCPKLMSILSLIPEGDVSFEIEQKESIQIAVIKHSTKKIRFTLRCGDVAKFPQIENFGDVEFFDIPAKDLKEMITHTIFAVGTDMERLMLTGVHFEKSGNDLVLVATDRGRVAYEARPLLADVPELKPIIVPPKVLNIVAKHASDEGSISLAITEKCIIFKFSNYVISSNLIDAVYPNFRRIFPENSPFKFIVQLDEFQAAVKRISVMSEDKDRDKVRIFFDIVPGLLSIHAASDLGEAREEIPCQYAGENVSLAFKTKHIEDAIKNMDSESAAFEFSEAGKGVILRTEPASTCLNLIVSIKTIG